MSYRLIPRRSVPIIAIVLLVPAVLARLSFGQQDDSATLTSLLSTYQGNRAAEGRDQDWQYVLKLAQAGFDAWAIETRSTGNMADRAYKVRTELFYWSWRAAGQWQYDYYDNITGASARHRPPYESGYVYTSFIIALFMEDSGDFWKARSYYTGTLHEVANLVNGQSIPLYNGTPVNTLSLDRIRKLDALISHIGSVEPYRRTASLAMSNVDSVRIHSAAVDFDRTHANDIRELLPPPIDGSALSHLDAALPRGN